MKIMIFLCIINPVPIHSLMYVQSSLWVGAIENGLSVLRTIEVRH